MYVMVRSGRFPWYVDVIYRFFGTKWSITKWTLYGVSGTCLEEDEVHEQFVYGKLGGGDEIEDDVDMDDVITVTHVDLDDPHHSPSSTDMTDDTSDPGKSEIHHVHHVYSITMLLVLALGLVLSNSPDLLKSETGQNFFCTPPPSVFLLIMFPLFY